MNSPQKKDDELQKDCSSQENQKNGEVVGAEEPQENQDSQEDKKKPRTNHQLTLDLRHHIKKRVRLIIDNKKTDAEENKVKVTNEIDVKLRSPVFYCHSPNTSLKFVIIDDINYITEDIGDTIEITIEDATHDEIKLLKTARDSSDTRYCKVVNSVDETFIASVEDNESLFKYWSDIFVLQGYAKDVRLVTALKPLIISMVYKEKSFDVFRVDEIQSKNNHTFLFTNSDTGKTAFCKNVLGLTPFIDPTIAGLLGGRDGGKFISGDLSGGGVLFLDEINVSDVKIFSKILTYMEQGDVKRAITGSSSCQGIKTIVFSGNPKYKEELLNNLSFLDILQRIAGVESPERVGRRLGVICFGNDYARVSSMQVKPYFEDISNIRLFYKELIRANIGKIFMLKDMYFEFYFEKSDFDTYVSGMKEFATKIRSLKNENVALFVEGFVGEGALKRTVSAGLNNFIYDNLFRMTKIKEDDESIEKFIEENMDAIKDCIREVLSVNYDSVQNISNIRIPDRNEGLAILSTHSDLLKDVSTYALSFLLGVDKEEIELMKKNVYRGVKQ